MDTEKLPATNYVDEYVTKLANYGGKGLLVGAVSSYLLLSRWKLGAIAGFGIGAGYCNPELFRIIKNFKQ